MRVELRALEITIFREGWPWCFLVKARMPCDGEASKAARTLRHLRHCLTKKSWGLRATKISKSGCLANIIPTTRCKGKAERPDVTPQNNHHPCSRPPTWQIHDHSTRYGSNRGIATAHLKPPIPSLRLAPLFKCRALKSQRHHCPLVLDTTCFCVYVCTCTWNISHKPRTLLCEKIVMVELQFSCDPGKYSKYFSA